MISIKKDSLFNIILVGACIIFFMIQYSDYPINIYKEGCRHFIISNTSKDTVVLYFFKNLGVYGYSNLSDSKEKVRLEDGNCIDYSSFILGNLQNSSGKEMPVIPGFGKDFPLTLEDKKCVFDVYIKDSVFVRELLYDRYFVLRKKQDIIYGGISDLDNWPNSFNQMLNYSPSGYYAGDTLMYNLILNNIIPIYLPPKCVFIKKAFSKYDDLTTIQEAFPHASKISILSKGKEISSINIKNMTDIMRKRKFCGLKDSYLFEISDDMVVK